MAMPPDSCRWGLAALALLACAEGFPGRRDPVTAAPPPARPASAELCAELAPVVEAKLVGYGEVVRGAYEPPPGCRGPWAQVLLELTGFVRGVQFDRYGALWLRGVELLRTTTPEPNAEGIVWHVTKDVSDYAQVFEAAGEVALMIPNIVNAIYTGELYVNISFAFYQNSSTAVAPDLPDLLATRTIIPLRNLTGARNPFGEIGVNGELGQVNLVSLPQDTIQARLDLYASGHGCEEFWYTNPLEAEPGGCGGGAYRELTVFVDGQLAGVAYPFPVLYTGGVNPLLWRPLVGIHTFDLPAYEFDLTPFLAWLADGESHNITLAVFGIGPGGTWFLDGVLALRRGGAGPARGGSVEVLEAAGPDVVQASENVSEEVVLQTMEGRERFHVRGSLVLASGEVLRSEVATELRAESTNEDLGSGTSVTSGSLRSRSVSVRGGLRATVEAEYPFYVFDQMGEDNETVQLNTSVRYAYSMVATYTEKGGTSGKRRVPPYSVAFYNGIDSNALVNVSKENHTLNKEASGSAEEFRVWTGAPLPPLELADRAWRGGGLCCERLLRAGNGSITEDHGECNCTWPRGLYACGSQLCGTLTLPGSAAAMSVAEARPPAPTGRPAPAAGPTELRALRRPPRR